MVARARAAAAAAKKGKDKDKKKGGKDDKKKAKPATPAAAQVHEFRKEVRAAKKLRKELELAEFQRARMHDRLPPLSRFLKGWRLDAWQKKVLRHIDNGKSAVVCAPTSSGKTVISTYTCVANERVLFVVPTEPLVWQVAAMFEKLLQGSARVALATNQLAYRPSEDRSRVVVGTPLALESSLVKIRGQVGEEWTATRARRCSASCATSRARRWRSPRRSATRPSSGTGGSACATTRRRATPWSSWSTRAASSTCRTWSSTRAASSPRCTPARRSRCPSSSATRSSRSP